MSSTQGAGTFAPEQAPAYTPELFLPWSSDSGQADLVAFQLRDLYDAFLRWHLAALCAVALEEYRIPHSLLREQWQNTFQRPSHIGP